MIDEQLAKTQPAILRPHIHALELTILGAEELDAAAAGRITAMAQHEKRDPLRDQLLDTVTMTALGRIERVQMRFQLRNKQDGVGTIGTLARDDGLHGLAA